MPTIKRSLNVLLIITLLSACRTAYVYNQDTHAELFSASLDSLKAGNAKYAAGGFDQLVFRLGARDPLLPLSHFYLGQARLLQKEYQSAAESFERVHAIFPGDTLADDALLAASRAYRKLWRDLELDKQYGETSQLQLTTLLENYPQTPLRQEVFDELNSLEDDFARKDLLTAEFYFRLQAFTSAKDYARQIIEDYPTTRAAREARLLMIRSFIKLKWADDLKEQCQLGRDQYPGDAEFARLCRTVVVSSPAR